MEAWGITHTISALGLSAQRCWQLRHPPPPSLVRTGYALTYNTYLHITYTTTIATDIHICIYNIVEYMYI